MLKVSLKEATARPIELTLFTKVFSFRWRLAGIHPWEECRLLKVSQRKGFTPKTCGQFVDRIHSR